MQGYNEQNILVTNENLFCDVHTVSFRDLDPC